MQVERLSLQDFRSYAELRIDIGPKLVVLTGENGAGKTNVLEAISLLTPGRGLRGAALADMARAGGGGGFAVAARLDRAEIGTGTLAASPDRRQVRINGAPAPANRLSEYVSVLWLTPAMDRLFAEPAGGRRRFLDRLVLALAPEHAFHSARYEAAMRARNKLLAQEEAADPAWLAALEARMAEHGTAVAKARLMTVAALGARLAEAPAGPFARAALQLEGGDETDLESLLKLNRGRDAAAGRALAGPHRTDLSVLHLGKRQPAASCSTGEQKALLIGIILAHAVLVAERSGQAPILLLDEVAAHLDASRRRALFSRLEASGGQVWMTGTETLSFDGVGPDTHWLHVRDGRIEQA